MNAVPINAKAVTRFVREVLGCNCPDEVFQRMCFQRGSTAVRSCPVDYELQIGGRLLIVVSSAAEELANPAILEEVIGEGKRARDRAKFNRFRLIVPAGKEESDALLRSFLEIKNRDEKTHLHVVEPALVPQFV